MKPQPDDRITLEVTDETVAVELVLGEVRVGVQMPLPPGTTDMSTVQLRSLVLKSARRALEVARQELE